MFGSSAISLDSNPDQNQLHELNYASDVALKKINLLYEEILGIKDLKFNEISFTNKISEDEEHENVKNHYLKTCCTTLQELCFKCERYLSKCSSCNRCSCDSSNIVILKNQKFSKSLKRSPNASGDVSMRSPIKCTVPKPFSFYDKDNEWLRAKELKLSRIKDQINSEIEKELNVRVQSKPVPKNTHLPLYKQMVQEKVELKNFKKEKCREKLCSEKQFNLHEENIKSTSDIVNKNLNNFKAKPLPKHILSSQINQKIKNREEVRRMLLHERAKHILKTSSLPFSERPPVRSRSIADISGNNKENNKNYSKVKISEITKRLYAKKCKETMNAWNEKVSEAETCRKVMQDNSLDKYTYDNSKITTIESLPFYFFPVRMSNAALLRDKQIREEILLRKEREVQENAEKGKKDINKDIAIKLRNIIPTPERQKEIYEKVKSYREWQEKRQEEYEQELKEIMSRVAEQSLLLERISKGSKTTILAENTKNLNENKSEMSEIPASETNQTVDVESNTSRSTSIQHSKEAEQSDHEDTTESKSL